MLYHEFLYYDFAYSSAMQIILFLYNVVFITFLTYLTTNIILGIYQQPASFKHKLIFSFLTGTLTHIIFIYGVAAIRGYVILNIGRMSLGYLYHFVTVTNPVYIILLYFLGVKIFPHSRFSSIKIMRLTYVYFLICFLITKMVQIYLFPHLADPRGYNYLIDFSALLIDTLLIYILYQVVMHIVHKTDLAVQFPDNLVVQNVRRELIKSFVYSLFLYVFVVSLLYYEKLDFLHYLFLIGSLFMYMAISISLDFISMKRINLVNKDVHIASLSKAVDGFKDVKHDFYNILQTYSSYLYIKDYDELNQYHQTLLDTTKLEDDRLDIRLRMRENPGFYALLFNKLGIADKKAVSLELNILTGIKDICMDNLDFCRIFAILLDNALEAAELTVSKKVSLLIDSKVNSSTLIVLSHSTNEPIDTQKIMLEGFAAKPNHMGQGLKQVRSILSKYGNCTLNVNYYDSEFTVYLEIRDQSAKAEIKRKLYLVKNLFNNSTAS